MQSLSFEGLHGRTIALDICHACQAFWFDGFESLQLSPGSVLQLFRTIGERTANAPAVLLESAACPRCERRLSRAIDQQRQTRFEYRKCPDGHGRLITYFNFLREKDFIRPLSKNQIDELRKNVRAINCSNCGAPVDLAAGSSCAHCGSPLSMIDLAQAGALVTRLREASNQTSGTVDPALPLALARAKREVTTAFSAFDGEPDFFDRASSAGLVGAALESIARWIR